MSHPTLTKSARIYTWSAQSISTDQVKEFRDAVETLCLYNHEWTHYFQDNGKAEQMWSFKGTSIPQLLEEITKLNLKCPFFNPTFDLFNAQPVYDEDGESAGIIDTYIGTISIIDGKAIIQK
jgi:hypothetical protein